MKNLKERGITLIALVITIVVLLILAGVSLSIVFNGGIIDKSQRAVDDYAKAKQNEMDLLDDLEIKLELISERKEAEGFYYKNITTKQYYETLKSAIDDVESEATIILVNDKIETETITIASNQNIRLELNGKTITFDGAYSLINEGTLKMTGSGKLIGSTAHTIVNSGTLNIDMDNETAYNNGTGGIIANTWPRVTNQSINVIANASGTINLNSGIIANEATADEISTQYYPYAINSAGTLNINGGIVRSISSGVYTQRGIYSSGILNIIGGTVETIGVAIDIGGTQNTTITGGTIKSLNTDESNRTRAINFASTGILEISGINEIKIISNSQQGVQNQSTGIVNINNPNAVIEGITGVQNQSTGIVNIYNSNICATLWDGVYNAINGTVNIYGGTIRSKKAGIINAKNGTMNVSGGLIDATGTFKTLDETTIITVSGSNGARNFAGTLNITGGTIKANSCGIYTYIETGKNQETEKGTGIINITGGTIETIGSTSYGIYDIRGSTITIGDNSNAVSTTVPEIIGKTNGIYRNALAISSGTLNFYDGVIRGSVDNSIIGSGINIPEGYEIEKTISTDEETESAILKEIE